MADTTRGYYRQPTLCGDAVIFVCEADLWAVNTDGGQARRLTAHRVVAATPLLSPNGQWVAFVNSEEGTPEIYVMPANGGLEKRLTWQGATLCLPVGWHPYDGRVMYASVAEQPFRRPGRIWAVSPEGGAPELLPWGAADRVAFGPSRGLVLGRNIGDPARWKRYRGGTAGDLWIDPNWEGGVGEFQRLIRITGNVTSPMWIGERIWFLSDHEGWGNLYSCTPEGTDLTRHTHHEEFYARNASTDGKRIVYQRAGEIHVFDVASDEDLSLNISVSSSRPQMMRKWVSAADYLESSTLHPQGHSLAMTARGKTFTLGNWEGPVRQYGERDGVRYRLTRWLHDGERIVTISDAGGEELLEIYRAGGNEPPIRLDDVEIGRPILLEVSPTADRIALTNHRYELILVDLNARTKRQIDRSEYAHIQGLAWSPDGRWVAYGFADSSRTAHLRVVNVEENGASRPLTESVLWDSAPHFDPDGKWLYFLSRRTFDPVYDDTHFALGFPRGTRPYVLLLTKDVRSPFDPQPHTPGGGTDKPQSETKDSPPAVQIDFDRLTRRVLAFPVEEGLYERVQASRGGKVFYDVYPIKGSRDHDILSEGSPQANGTLKAFDFEIQKEEVFLQGVSGFRIAADGTTMLINAGRRLRVVKTGSKPNASDDKPGRASGWIDLSRPRLSILPQAEWRQMFREAWRLQRDQFWDPDMSGIDWVAIYNRWLPVLDRVATRGEFSDLMWEVQGELGTSHAYELGGDLPPSLGYRQGTLGADFEPTSDGWRIGHIVQGDSWDRRWDSPLNEPGVDVHEGDILVAVDGQPLETDRHPNELLAHQAGVPVVLTLRRVGQAELLEVVVKPLQDGSRARYREWVEQNRRTVHEATAGRVGYVHIPDMGPLGFGEFHRYWLQENGCEGLIVDVRFNGGGHVSSLLLEKLGRQVIGWRPNRHGTPSPYPPYALRGPLVAVTNEWAGSDGDIFSHSFKRLGLGPLIGKRTWGGVIGISPQHLLVDRTLTTQAEFATWFDDVGWGVENYGTDPDIEVEITPQEYAAGRDPQLQKAIQVILETLEQNPPKQPTFEPPPSLMPPRLSGKE